MMGRDWRLRTAASTGLLFIPGWFSMWTYMMILAGGNSQLVYQSALAAFSTVRRSYQQRHLSVVASSTYWFPVSRDISGSNQYSLVFCHPKHLWSKREVGEGNENLVYRPRGTSRDLLRAVKSYDMGPPALLSIRREVCCGFVSPVKIHHHGRARTRNHCTTKTTFETLLLTCSRFWYKD
jgi:hypothetical protein